MMTKILLAAAFIATVVVVPAHARIVTNGGSENGVTLNGVGENGVALNGAGENGVALNGFGENGVTLNGSGENGVGLNGIGGLRHRGLNGTVIRIEF